MPPPAKTYDKISMNLHEFVRNSGCNHVRNAFAHGICKKNMARVTFAEKETIQRVKHTDHNGKSSIHVSFPSGFYQHVPAEMTHLITSHV